MSPLASWPRVCRKNNVLLVITADHGMCFPDTKGKGGHSADKYAGRLESLRVPLVFKGPGVEELNLGGRWSEMDIASTVLGLLNISLNLTADGNPLPVREGYDLRVAGPPAGVELWHGDVLLANGASGGDYSFRGLPLGFTHSNRAESPGRVLVNGDKTMDLAGKAAPSGDMKKMIGIILILAINLVGIALIIHIWKKG